MTRDDPDRRLRIRLAGSTLLVAALVTLGALHTTAPPHPGLATVAEPRFGFDRDPGSARRPLLGPLGMARLDGSKASARALVVCASAGCQTSSRQLSHDPFVDLDGQHETEVEPDSFAFGRTIVAVFQMGRSGDGGAAANGFATSRDAGRTWHSGILPGLTFSSVPPGPFERASDPAVGYDARHGVWLASSLALGSDGLAVVVSRSRDGVTWGAPVPAAGPQGEEPDKEWVVCDNGRASRFRGSCYLAYDDVRARTIAVRASRDGGLTWGRAVPTVNGAVLNAIVNGAQPVVQPGGTLAVLYTVFGSARVGVDEIAVLRSTDGGLSFEPTRRVAELRNEDVEGLRVPPFASAEVAGDGRIWAAWSDCRFRADCDVNDVVLSSSADAVTWTAPVRVPTGNAEAATDAVLPGLGVDPSSAGTRTRLGLVYHLLPQQGSCGFAACPGVSIAFVGSRDGGRTWSAPVRLTTRAMPLDWIADGALGALLGDYVSTSWVGGRPIPVFSLAARPVGEELRQSIFAATRIAGFPATAS